MIMFFKRKLANQLILGVSIVHAVLMTIFVGQFVLEHQESLEKSFEVQSLTFSRLAAHSSLSWILTSDFAGLKELIDTIKNSNVEYVEFVNEHGKVLASSNPNIVGQYVNDEESLTLLSKSEHHVQHEDQTLYIAYPIKLKEHVKGWIKILFKKSDLTSEQSKLIWQGFFFSLLAILAGSFLAWLLIKGITLDLAKFVEVTNLIKEGDNSVRINLKRSDELGFLAINFNRMLDRIKEKEREKQIIQGQLIQASKMASLGELSAGVAHEVNNPLAIISGSVSFLIEKNLESHDEFSKKYLLNISHSVERIANIVRSLKIYSHNEQQVLSIFDLNLICQQTIEMIQPIYRKDFVKVFFESEVDEALTKGNRGHLQQVLLNLLSNAKDAIVESQRNDGSILVHLSLEERVIKLSITDNGSGIPDDKKDKIFNSFFTTKVAGKGTGLGLAICCNLMKSMNGNIELLSTSSQGTTFLLTLPLSNEKASVEMIKKDKLQLSNDLHLKILVIEDEIHWADILVYWLNELNIKTDVVKSVKEAKNQLLLQEYDLYIIDYILEDGYASELFQYGHSFTNLNSIVLTGENELDIKFSSKLKEHNIQVFNKPIEKSRLIAIISSIFKVENNKGV